MFENTAGVDRQRLAAGAAPARAGWLGTPIAAFLVKFMSPARSVKLGKTAISADCLAF
jgi:hypothetical protein